MKDTSLERRLSGKRNREIRAQTDMTLKTTHTHTYSICSRRQSHILRCDKVKAFVCAIFSAEGR